MSHTPEKPILVYITPPGPNSWKTVLLLEELGLNYKLQPFRFDDIKKPPFIGLNPNGRVPAIKDPNTGLTLWESGAINQYIIEQYDIDKRLTYDTLHERHLLNQWLQFQMSGQGPYYGQCSWFQHLHHEKFPSAIERYAKEIKRIIGVTEVVPAKKGSNPTSSGLLSEVLLQSWDEVWEGAPYTRAWHQLMVELPSWKRIMETRAHLMDEQGLQWNGVPKGIDTFTEYEAKIAAGEDTTVKE